MKIEQVFDGYCGCVDEESASLVEDRHVVCDQPGLGRDFGHGFVSAEFGQRYQAGRRCDALDPGRGDRFGAQQEPGDAGQVTGIPGQAADCLLGAAYQVVEVGGSSSGLPSNRSGT